MDIKQQYEANKLAKVNTQCKCPSCGTAFNKSSYQQVFCKSKNGTVCKDKYWNTVTPTKRNNKTRISPASRRWLNQQRAIRFERFDPHDYEHPFSSEALGQW